MNPDFWHERWHNDQIGFHQPEGQPLLREHWASLGLPTGARILVPLCGKTRDMAWLAEQGFNVTGIELSAKAAQDFFAESGQTPKHTQKDDYDCYRAGGVEILVGDFFSLSPATLAAFDGVYDRAALIALPLAMRERYAAHLLAGLQTGSRGLLIAFEYDQDIMAGPPFSVGPAEVRRLFAGDCEIEQLAERRGLPEMSHLRKRGLTDAIDRIYRLTRR